MYLEELEKVVLTEQDSSIGVPIPELLQPFCGLLGRTPDAVVFERVMDGVFLKVLAGNLDGKFTTIQLTGDSTIKYI